jgi:myosin-crossreactive antigen
MDRHTKMKVRDDSSVNVYLNGLGLGSIAAAIYLIQKADFDPSHIHIFEQMGATRLQVANSLSARLDYDSA